jgi:uncharacterized protein (TIGR02453 family)
MGMASGEAYFTPALFDFLRRLKKNNNRDWYLKNKARYESDVRDPALRFVDALAPRLRKISPHLVADSRPVGGSMFRINRDIRFSIDKSPYKTNVGMSFGHDLGRQGPAPGLYLHLEPGTSFGGGGVHMPDGPTLTKIRDAIVADASGWKRIVNNPRSKSAVANMGESLKRAPQGYDPNHPMVEDLKRKSYTWHAMFSEAEVCGRDFADRFLDVCKTADPFDRFLAKALGVGW